MLFLLRFVSLAVVLAVIGPGYGPALARPALVFEAQSGKVLIAEDAGKPWYPASLTKLLTAYIVFDEIKRGRLSYSSRVKISRNAAKQPPSKLGIRAGKSLSVEMALTALLVRSTNDIAVALAEKVAGSVPAFARRMNATARKLGMHGSHFANPHGLFHKDQWTTARDLGLLARALLRDHPRSRRFFSRKSFTWGKRKLRNRNRLLTRLKGANGMKTGYICESGFNLVASATRKGRNLIAVVMGSPSGGYRFDLAANLLEQGFATRAGTSPLKIAAIKDITGQKPPSLRPQLCQGVKVARITKPGDLQGWGVLFGIFKSKKRARHALDVNLAGLRGAVRGAQAAVLNGRNGTVHAAVMAGLKLKQVMSVCGWLSKRGNRCITLNPAELKNPRALWR